MSDPPTQCQKGDILIFMGNTSTTESTSVNVADYLNSNSKNSFECNIRTLEKTCFTFDVNTPAQCGPSNVVNNCIGVAKVNFNYVCYSGM